MINKNILNMPEYSFLKENQNLDKNICILGLGGSRAYGTNLPESDIDIREELNRHISGVLNNMSKKMNDKYNLDENNVSFYLVDGKIKCNIIATQCSMEDLSGMLSEFNNTLRDYRKTSKRNEHALNHGKIAKHSMHLLRLYMMGIDLVSEGKIQTKRIKEHDLLMDIRNGVYLDENGIPNKHFFEIVDEYKNKFENACKNSVLPDEPDIDKINTFRMEVNEKIVKL